MQKTLTEKFNSIRVHLTPKNKALQRTLFILLASLPILLYGLPFLLTGELLAPGDADYLMQTQEAMRQSILTYGQFPWWNPWVSGGVPLFANPQFGLYSITTLFTLPFGAVLGYKLALIAYLVFGFWGIYLLTRKGFKTPLLTALLLAYIWVFGSFFAERIAGHYTFFTIQFFPYLLFIYLKRHSIKYSYLWFGFAVGMMMNAATHNTSLMSLAVLALFVVAELIRIVFQRTKGQLLKIQVTINYQDLKFFALAVLTAIVIAGQKLYFSLQYLGEYPRHLASSEDSIGILKALGAMFGPGIQYGVHQPSIPNWTWMEVSAYIGLLTGIAAILCAIGLIRHAKSQPKKAAPSKYPTPLLVVILGVIFFLFGLGMFAGELSPYHFLHQLPVFSGMRVATRWIAWASLMVILFIGLYHLPAYRKIINALLLISVIELFISGAPQLASQYTIQQASYTAQPVINQQIHFDTHRNNITYDENLTATTRANIGQLIAGDALVDTRNQPPIGENTIRCQATNTDCSFVLTKNAIVKEWSPNKIILERTGVGPIELNMNPGKYWLVNNAYPFHAMRLAEPAQRFIIEDGSETITIKQQPKFSFGWLLWKIGSSS